jgi:hypothetical protein
VANDSQDDVVGATVVPNESEALLACNLLRANGIECNYRLVGVGAGFGGPVGPCEVLVHARDQARAKELLGETA